MCFMRSPEAVSRGGLGLPNEEVFSEDQMAVFRFSRLIDAFALI